MSTLQGIGARVGRLIVISILLLNSGCSYFAASIGGGLADNLSAAVLNQNDPETVRDGAPAYLLLLDSFLEGNPDSPVLLAAGANLYATYGSVFAEDPQRAARLTERARGYSSKAICIRYKSACNWVGMPFEEYVATLDGLTKRHADVVFSHGLASLAYIRTHSSDYTAIAMLPYSQALLERYLEINDGSDDGAIHTYLGILDSLLPASLGGEPEQARAHFERAIELSGGRNLGAKVEFAEGYARLLYERELHDKLLNEVIAADPIEPGNTLLNVLAQERAVELLANADDYF
jgi:hypothetical protein